MSDPDGRNAPSVLQRGIRILRAFSVEEPQLSVTEIARRVELHKSTVSRILAQLEGMELVTRAPDSGHFHLGLGLIGLTGPLLANLDVRRIAYPALAQLTERTHETSALTVWSGHASVSVEEVASPQQVKHTSPIGTRYATAASASVRVFLASIAQHDAREFLETRLGAPSDVQDYLDRLEKVRLDSVAVNDGDTSVDEVGISAPVRDHRENTVAAVLLSVPRYRVSDELRPLLVDAVRSTAGQISERLGARPSESALNPQNSAM